MTFDSVVAVALRCAVNVLPQAGGHAFLAIEGISKISANVLIKERLLDGRAFVLGVGDGLSVALSTFLGMRPATGSIAFMQARQLATCWRDAGTKKPGLLGRALCHFQLRFFKVARAHLSPIGAR